jgi:hypothetical protein
MAMNEINRVPANRGMAPKAPEEPTWSARMAVWGLHSRPNRKSVTGTVPKKRVASNSTDSTIPRVVNMAMVEQAIMNQRTTDSTRLRARRWGEIVFQARPAPSAARAITAANRARDPLWRRLL